MENGFAPCQSFNSIIYHNNLGQRTIPTTFQITFYCYIMEPEEIGQDDWQQPLVRYLSDFKKYAKRCQACKKDGPVQHVPASELHPILKTSRLDALIPCFTSARSHVGKYALAKLCLTQNQSGKGREELKKKTFFIGGTYCTRLPCTAVFRK